MAGHDDLLNQGPREAPEPETAEQRTKRLSGRAVGGGVLGGGAIAAKAGALGALGGLGKVFIWLVAWHGLADIGHIFGWIGILAALGAVVLFVVLRRQRSNG